MRRADNLKAKKGKVSHMIKKVAILGLLVTGLVGTAFGQEGPVPKGVPHLDHVFIIMMENHGFSQILNNPNAPFVNQLAKSANTARKYFAVGHPSLTNYLEVVGGSNFGVRSDNFPDWHNSACATNLATGTVATDNPPSSLICPIGGTGTDAATPALDCTNEVTGPPCLFDIDGTLSIPAAPTVGKTIADQLADRGRSWKSYQENLPPGGADRVNISDGFFSNLTDFSTMLSSFSSWTVQGTTVPAITTQAQAQGDIVALYAVKHNPFVYFQNVQEGHDWRNSLNNVVGFEGSDGLFADVASGDMPNFSFIAPNQCNDQHGRGNAGPFCNFDPNDNGLQPGLNEALILRGDITVQRIVTAIKSSRSWREGNNAIVVMWDENDFTATPNQVMLVMDTNHGRHGVQSGNFYTHFALLKSLEAGFRLPCLNHACDGSVQVMSDLFASGDRDDDR
jgi:phosphatidylinositol-3-phosphatase